jgi:sugar/nucleoside kinase (ribokinase family)
MALAATLHPAAFARAPRATAARFRGTSASSRTVAPRRSPVPSVVVARLRSVPPPSRGVLTRAAARADSEYAGPLDVVALGNMCVDILHPPAPIPDPAELKTEAFLATLDATGYDASSRDAAPSDRWEVGGNCNFLIAAARLGLRAECVGHVGDDARGAFLRDTLAAEGVPLKRLASPELVADAARKNERMDKTLTCHVLSDGVGGHAFCSRYDLGPWPLLSEVRGVDDDAARALGRADAVFVNGFVFDELRPSAVKSAVAIAKANGAKVFFDPGPRAFTFRVGDAARVEALDSILGDADVVLATLEEAAALVDAGDFADAGHGALGGTAVGAGGVSKSTSGGVALDPATVATQLLKRPGCAADWVVIKCGPDGASVFTRRGDQVYVGSPAVEVGDTVGCGDSAAAAVVLGYAKICAAREKLFQASSGKIAYLPNARLAAMMEETLALATATGAATATTKGAGRNVATAELVEELLDRCVCDEETCLGWGINAAAATRAKELLDASLKKSGRR